jgi:two-component system, NtrC family, sensor kinase
LTRRRQKASPKPRSRSPQQTLESLRRSLTREREQRKHALAREKEALEQQTATGEILQVIASASTEVQPVFDTIARNAVRLGNAAVGFLISYDGTTMRLAAQHNVDPQAESVYRPAFPRPAARDTMTGRSIVDCTVINLPDIQGSDFGEGTKERARRAGYRSALIVPMLRGGVPIGSLNIQRREVGAFSDSYVSLLKTFADQAVIAIENARLFNETQEALERQTATSEILHVISSSPSDLQPVFDTIVRNFMALCGATFGGVFTFDGELVHNAGGLGFSPEQERARQAKYPVRVDDPSVVSARTIMARAPVHIDDTLTDPNYDPGRAATLGARRIIGVPLLRDGVPLGAIVASWAEPGATPKGQEELLKTFADQAVIAIENARLFNETKEALEQQTATAEILKVIASSPSDVQPVFDAIVKNAGRLASGSSVNVTRIVDDHLHLAAYTRISDSADEALRNLYPFRIAAAPGVREAVETRAPSFVADFETDARVTPKSRAVMRARGFRSTLYVPIVRHDAVLGMMHVSRAEPGPFPAQWGLWLKTFADQAAIAIENVRLFNETKEALDQQKALADVLAVISRSMSALEPVFETILSNAIRLCEGARAVLWRYDGSHLHVAAHKNTHPQGIEYLKEHPLELGTYNATPQAALERRAVHVVDAFADPNYRPLIPRGTVPGSTPTPTVLAVPLLRDDDLLGVITIWRTEKRPFSDKQITMVNAFASQAVIAIENVRLFREIHEKSAQLEVANKHKSDFLANMSHELRTPLNAIIGFSEVMMDRMFGDLNEKQLDYQKDIHESGKHLLSLINDILDLSKIEAGRMELELSTFHLPTAVSNAVTLIRERALRHGIALGVEVDPRLGDFQADERKVKQILLNLLSNAVKFTPDGGRVDVAAKLDADTVEISVKDTGVGIASEDQASLFEEFKQLGKDSSRKAEGTGLGLALTKRLVELHGGQIAVESAVGRGSTFRVTLRCA